MTSQITRNEALKQADEILIRLLKTGDSKIYNSAGGNEHKILSACIRARESLADKIMRGEL